MAEPCDARDGDSVLRLVPGDRPDEGLDAEELGSRIVGLAGRLAAATCRWLLLVAAFDAAEGCARFGLPTTARWLSHYCGLSRRTAIEHVRVARALAAHPPLAAAMSAGRLSYSHVRAISRVIKAGEAELLDDLVCAAERASVGQLETLVRGLRTVEHNEHGDEPGERVSLGWAADSRWRLSAHLDPEHGALVRSALDAVARREGITQAQALTRMAEIALAATSGQGEAAPVLRGEENAAVVIHLDAAAVPAAGHDAAGVRSREHPSPDQRPYARVQDGPGLPDHVVKRLLCAGRIRTAVHGNDGSLLDLGRSHRLVSKRQFRALLLRDRGCTFPGCESRAGLEAHHVRHWIDGGGTDLANLVLLCRAHHHAHHDGAFTIAAAGHGRFRFRDPRGRQIPGHIDPAEFIADPLPVDAEHALVAADAATTRWDGTRMDRHFAIACLAQRRAGPRAPAPSLPAFDPWAAPPIAAELSEAG